MVGLLKRYGDTDFITGMRAIAALGVILIHTGGAGLRSFGPLGNSIVDYGSTGVTAFFVISGFSVAANYVSAETYGQYLVRRFMRIVPLFYAWLFFMAVWFWPLPQTQPYSVALWASFLAWLDASKIGVIGVEWTLPIEVFWYVCFPLLIFAIRGPLTAVIAVPVSYWAYVILRNIATHLPLSFNVAPGAEFANFYATPLPYFFCFALGLAAYQLRQEVQRRLKHHDAFFVALIVSLFIYWYSPSAVMHVTAFDQTAFVAFLTFACILFGSTSKSWICRFALSNPIALFFGTISYGLYLSHIPASYINGTLFKILPAANSLWAFISTLGLATACSVITYLLIERPGNRYGAKLLRASKLKSERRYNLADAEA